MGFRYLIAPMKGRGYRQQSRRKITQRTDMLAIDRRLTAPGIEVYATSRRCRFEAGGLILFTPHAGAVSFPHGVNSRWRPGRVRRVPGGPGNTGLIVERPLSAEQPRWTFKHNLARPGGSDRNLRYRHIPQMNHCAEIDDGRALGPRRVLPVHSHLASPASRLITKNDMQFLIVCESGKHQEPGVAGSIELEPHVSEFTLNVIMIRLRSMNMLQLGEFRDRDRVRSRSRQRAACGSERSIPQRDSLRLRQSVPQDSARFVICPRVCRLIRGVDQLHQRKSHWQVR